MECKLLSLILIAILLTGCAAEKTRTVTTTKYVCSDKSIVSDPERCERVEYRETITEKPGNCPEPKPSIIETIRYACPDGSVVNSPGDCHPPELGTTSTTKTTTPPTTAPPTTPTTTTTTTTTTSTTTTLKTPPIGSCTSLGCPPKTEFVGSESSDKYHKCDCRYAVRIKPENIVCFNSKEDAESKGYAPCGVCIKE